MCSAIRRLLAGALLFVAASPGGAQTAVGSITGTVMDRQSNRPIEGVQVRLGYSAMTYFNTKYMEEPVAFNFGALDPAYGTRAFRIVHGLHFGVGLFF